MPILAPTPLYDTRLATSSAILFLAGKHLSLASTPMAKTKDMPQTETSFVACRFYFELCLKRVTRQDLFGKIIFRQRHQACGKQITIQSHCLFRDEFINEFLQTRDNADMRLFHIEK